MSTSPICPPRPLLEGLQALTVKGDFELKLVELEFMFWLDRTEGVVVVTCDAEPDLAICMYGEVPPSNEVFEHTYSQTLGLRNFDRDRRED